MKSIQIVLLILIGIGIGLLCTQRMWVPQLVAYILEGEVVESSSVIDTENVSVEGEEDLTTRPAGKIDVRVACESALMYTTFEDGAQADAFIAECIEGKYPEVIDRYIESLNVDGAVI
jgi:hypothetical protein